MVHLVIHNEAKVAGPIPFRWMYPIERLFVKEVKSRNRSQHPKEHEINKMKNEQFHSWFADHVSNLNEGDVSPMIKMLAGGPNNYASRKDNYPVEGDVEHYSVLADVFKSDYDGGIKVVLFKGDWVDVRTRGRGIKIDELGFTLVNFKHLMYEGVSISHAPFVIPSQGQPIFYVQDPEDKDWHVVLKTTPRQVFALGDQNEDKGGESNYGQNDNFSGYIIMGRSRKRFDTIILLAETSNTRQNGSGENANINATTNSQEPTDNNSNGGSSIRRRGKTVLEDVWRLPANQRLRVRANRFGQPVKDSTKTFTNYIGVELKKLQRIEEATKRSRAYQKITHTSGSKSFVRVEDELNEAAGSNVGRIKVYEVTHTRTNGSYLDPEIPVLLEKARAKKAERSGTQSTDSYQEDLEIMSEVLGNERPGRVRGLGLGPTPTRVFSPRVSTIHTDEEFEKLQREVVEQRGMIQSLHEKLDLLMQHMAMPQDVATNSTPGHRRVPSSHSRHGGLVLD
ncbi:hypothetical protein SLEP1_g59951 [Rubroshorea leprosula]|uniref:DUF4216 domain-containing protein n=2 Tax=Rubroshorea leprosula TaxID=152421 RepID=A0AAV5MV22_9ROSI|nr:hypothetical protein SLEP1_g59951 [Rubroshorea leprosula]